MSRLCRLLCMTLVSCFLTTAIAAASTHYIATNGSDSNDGSSTSTPWAHLPGMKTWTGSYTPVPGDIFVLRGCDVWTNTNFPINWKWAGSSGNPIVVGGDQNWYNTSSCSSWNRPVFNAGGTPISGTNAFVVANNGWTTWTWIEATGLQWTSNSGVYCVDGDPDGEVVDHWYIHNWHHSGSATSDEFACLQGGWPVGNQVMAQYNIFDGSDSSGKGDSGRFMYEWGGAKWNICHDTPNCYYFNYANHASPTEIAYNLAYNVDDVQTWDSSVHENVLETGGCGKDGNCNFYIHDNVFGPKAEAETMMVANSGETDYIWNNVIFNGWAWNEPQNYTPGVAMYIWNNTVNSSSQSCFSGGPSSPFSVIVFENNHCVNDNGLGAPGGGDATNYTDTDNILVTTSAGASQGYTQSEQFVYSPASGDCNGISKNCPIGAGANLTNASWFPAGFNTNDTTYACTQQTINGVIEPVCPAHTSNPRPTTGAWDVGAYQFSSTSSSGPPPNPPSGLAAVVN